MEKAEKERIIHDQLIAAQQKARDKLELEKNQHEAAQQKKELAAARERVRMDDEHAIMLVAADDNIHCTDYGNSVRFLKKYGRKILYCPEQELWYIWNGSGVWEKDSLLKVRELARDVLINIYEETQFKNDSDKRAAIAKWAITCEKPEHVTNCLRELMSRPTIAVSLDKFDSDKFLFNMKNGTYDLQNHLFLQHDRENFITRQVSYPFDPAATCPMFLEFLERIFRNRPDKAEIIEYLQKALGYSLTGDVSQQTIFLLHGSGSNGKSTLIETQRLVMGDYGTTISANSLITKKNDSVRNDIARLVNLRFVSTSENAKGTVLDEELIKNLTGGDQVAARFLFQEEFVFYPHLKLWWAFNHAPSIRDLTHSLWRRIKMIPFEEKIPDEERIDQAILLAMFEHELPGIFNWEIEGLKKFQQQGLKDIPAVSKAVAEFKTDQDRLHFFIEDCLYIPNEKEVLLQQDTTLSASAVFQRFLEWCDQTHERTMSQTKFGREMAERGFAKTHKKTGWVYHNIQLK